MFFFVGATPTGIDPATAPSNHSPQFLLDESALDLGLRAMLQVTPGLPERGAGCGAWRRLKHTRTVAPAAGRGETRHGRAGFRSSARRGRITVVGRRSPPDAARLPA